MGFNSGFKGLNAKLNSICHLLALLGAHHIFHVSRIRVKVISWIAFRHNYSLYYNNGDEDDDYDDDNDDEGDLDDSNKSNDLFSYDRVHVSTDYQPIIGVVVPCT